MNDALRTVIVKTTIAHSSHSLEVYRMAKSCEFLVFNILSKSLLKSRQYSTLYVYTVQVWFKNRQENFLQCMVTCGGWLGEG